MDWKVLHTTYGEQMDFSEAERRFYEIEGFWFSLELNYLYNKHFYSKSMHEGDYSSLVRCHEALKHLATQPSVTREFEYAKEEDMPLQKTLTQRIHLVKQSIFNLLSRTHRNAQPIRMGNPEEIENQVVENKT